MVITIVGIRAPNPSPLTLDGTNSYLVIDTDTRQALCIDPGPHMTEHITAILRDCAMHDAEITTIAITHGHPDHAPGALVLQSLCGAPIYAHSNSSVPHDISLVDQQSIPVGSAHVVAIDAPGHTFDHLVFYEPFNRALFTGDVLLGTGYVVIAPPGGAMRPYQRTLARLATEYAGAGCIYPGHGELVDDPAERIANYRAHREQREHELLAALARGPQTIPSLVERIYAQTPQALWPAAARQLLAYLLALEDEEHVRSHVVKRELTLAEATILYPHWATIVGTRDAPLVEAELGTASAHRELRAYELLT